MNYPLTGYHHITACAGGAREDVEFFTQSLGLRMAKQTVLMDGKFPIYHLYYSNANLEPGSVMTTFPRDSADRRASAGNRVLGVERNSAVLERLKRHTVTPRRSVLDRASFASGTPPACLLKFSRMMPTSARAGPRRRLASLAVHRVSWKHFLSVREIPETERFFIEALGFRKTGVDGASFETGTGGANRRSHCCASHRPAGSWTFGAGTVHHIALWAPMTTRWAEQREPAVRRFEIKDRFYFHSMYCRCRAHCDRELC